MELLLLLPLILLIRSDFREKQVGILPLLLLGILQWGWVFWEYGGSLLWWRIVLNGSVLLVMGMGVLLYLLVKYGKRTNPLNGFLGSGDIWFLICLLPAFEVKEFVWFLVISFLLTIAGWMVYRLSGKRNDRIPLVGTVGICYSIYLIYRFIHLRMMLL